MEETPSGQAVRKRSEGAKSDKQNCFLHANKKPFRPLAAKRNFQFNFPFYLSNFFNFYYERDRNLLFPMRAYDMEEDGTVVGKIAAAAFSHNKYDGN